MTQISGTNERFLQTPVILSEIMRIMEPDLAFIDVIPHVDSGGQPVIYGKKPAKSADSKKQIPRVLTPSSKFPEVQISRMTKETALLNKEGLAIRIDEDALKLPAGADMIMDAFQTVGYWIAENVNTVTYTALRAGGTDAGITPTAAWSESGATVMTDLRAFKNAMKREGYPYRMTDIFVEMVNFNELEGKLAADQYIPQYREAALKSTGSKIILPMEGNPIVHGLFSGVTHGDILGIDRIHNMAASLFYNNSPKYSVPTITYQTVVDNAVVNKTVPNIGLSTHQYFEDATHDTVIQIWLDYTVRVKDQYGILYDNGL